VVFGSGVKVCLAVAILVCGCSAAPLSPNPGAGGAGGAASSDALAALAIDDQTIDGASGAALLDLARAIGHAKGLAICECLPPNMNPPNPPLSGDALEQCAQAESNALPLFDPAQALCVLEQSQAIPGFDEFLRCRLKGTREVGLSFAPCAEGKATGQVLDAGLSNPVCDITPPPGAVELLADACSRAFLCNDGTLTMTGRCDAKLDCPDGADEHGCRELTCGDTIVNYQFVCDPQSCPASFTPPICVPGDLSRFLCGDGTDVSILVVCDGTKDCANGRDEQYCL
jgi:suppressor of tumorigenicity protein 14